MLQPLKDATIIKRYGEPDEDSVSGKCQGVRFLAYPDEIVSWNFNFGVVKEVGFLENRGNYVVVQKGWRRHYFYYLTHVFVKPGQRLRAATSIGRAGRIGDSNYPQLYYIVRTYPYGPTDSVRPWRYIK